MVTRRGRRRSAIIATATLAVAVAMGWSGARGAQAQEAFVEGRAQASAQVLAVVPELGSARLPITLGLATASFRARHAAAEATTIQFGLLGNILTVGQCGGDPLLTPDQLPAPLHASSVEGPDSRSREVAGTEFAFVGRESVEARPDAFGASDTSPAGVVVPGLLTVTGTAHAEAELVPGQLRRGGSTSEVGLVEIAGGVVRLEGLRWTAEQATGAGGAVETADGSFTVGRVVVAGMPLPAGDPGQLADAIEAANGVLEPLLLRIDLPTTTVEPNGTLDVSPLRLRVSGGSTTASILQPLIGGEQGNQARSALANALLFGGCEPGADGSQLQVIGGTANTVIDLAVAAILGGGAVGFEIGGARAGSDGTTVESPFEPGTTAPTLNVAAPAAPVDTAPKPPDSVSPPLPPATTTEAVTRPDPPPTSVEMAASTVTCVTTHPAGSPSCSAGRGVLAAGIALAAFAAVAGGDVATSHRPAPTRRKVR
jgi:hypothetical protein